MNVALIPARGGSKRIPRKNIKSFCGRPIMGWSISAARESGCFDHIVVSTDDEEIAQVAISEGAEAPFCRPPTLSDDHTPTRPVVLHAIGELERIYGKLDYVCCIYPTAPLMSSSDIVSGYKVLIESEASFAFSVATFPYPVERALTLNDKGQVTMMFPEHRLTRSQDLTTFFHDAGQFYWGKVDAFKEDLPTFSEHSVPVFIPRYRVQDIDTEEDWRTAELLFKAQKIGRSRD
jgi:N-acylneuraminate cytidylyltransferase